MRSSSMTTKSIVGAASQPPCTDATAVLNRASRYILVLQAFVIFHLLVLVLRVVPYRSIAARMLRAPRMPAPAPEAQIAIVEAVHNAIHLVRRFDYRVREDCLPRALTVYHLLADRGVPASFRIGVRRDPFGAHAWVEHDERIVGDTRNKTSLYAPLTRSTGSMTGLARE